MKDARWSRLAMIGAWTLGAAMLTGLVHVLGTSVRHFVLDSFIWVSREYVWMMPAGYAIVFAGVGSVLALLAVARPSLVGPRVTGFVFGTLASLVVLLLFERIHHLASLVAALGIGSRVAAWAARDARGRTVAMARAGILLALAFAVTGAALAAGRHWNERREIGSLTTARAQAPNVLLIILDTVRGASISFLGYERETAPSIARRGMEGVVFEQAHSTAPWTLPSHAGMFTGLYPAALDADWLRPLQGNQRTLAEVFRANGYMTAGFAANHFYTSWESGLTRGFVHYEDYRVTPRQILLSTEFFQTNLWRSIRHAESARRVLRAVADFDLRTPPLLSSHRTNAGLMTAQFLEWERSRPARPFFAFVNLFDAHAPYDPPAPWMRRFASRPRDKDRYDGAIAYMDHEVGALLDSLEKRGVLDNTVVVITSDHGEELGEHSLDGHGKSLYRLELHVPLIVRYPPRVPGGVRVSKVVTLRDLAVTLLNLAGLDAGGALPGASLTSAWSDAPSRGSDAISEVSAGLRTRPEDPVSRGPMRSLIDDEAHYIMNGDGVEELYDWPRDPGELQNLARVDTTRVSAARRRLGIGAMSGKR